MRSPRRLAGVAAVLYLIVLIVGILADLYVRADVLTPGDAVAIAGKVLAKSVLVRVGVSDLVPATLFVSVGMAVYLLLTRQPRPRRGSGV